MYVTRRPSRAIDFCALCFDTLLLGGCYWLMGKKYVAIEPIDKIVFGLAICFYIVSIARRIWRIAYFQRRLQEYDRFASHRIALNDFVDAVDRCLHIYSADKPGGYIKVSLCGSESVLEVWNGEILRVRLTSRDSNPYTGYCEKIVEERLYSASRDKTSFVHYGLGMAIETATGDYEELGAVMRGNALSHVLDVMPHDLRMVSVATPEEIYDAIGHLRLAVNDRL